MTLVGSLLKCTFYSIVIWKFYLSTWTGLLFPLFRAMKILEISHSKKGWELASKRIWHIMLPWDQLAFLDSFWLLSCVMIGMLQKSIKLVIIHDASNMFLHLGLKRHCSVYTAVEQIATVTSWLGNLKSIRFQPLCNLSRQSKLLLVPIHFVNLYRVCLNLVSLS